MKYTLVIFALVFGLIGSGNLYAQKIVVKKGDLKAIKSEKEINISYDYSEFGVGKFKTEAEYVSTKKAEYEEKEAGRGEKFEKGWIAARQERYEPKFEELINKYTEPKNMKIGDAPEAKYTLIVKTTFLEPGFNVGVMKKPAYVDFQYIFVETANRDNVVLLLEQKGVPGSQFAGYDYDVGSRVAESYAKGGKSLGKYIID